MLKDKKISVIGTGNMGEALISGLISSGSSNPNNIICTDVREDKLKSVKAKYGVTTTTDNIEAVKASEIVIYAVKPQIIASVLKETAFCLDMSKIIISIAAGVPMAAIESCLQKYLRLITLPVPAARDWAWPSPGALWKSMAGNWPSTRNPAAAATLPSPIAPSPSLSINPT